MRRFALCALLIALAAPAWAQDRASTLADMRQELTTLRGELARLRAELTVSGDGSGAAVAAGSGPLERLDGIEQQVQSLTAQAEQLAFRIDQIVRDGTNRLDDLEFRMVELEGGDVGQIAPAAPLGGSQPLAPAAQPVRPDAPVQFAVAETEDYEAIQKLLGEEKPGEALAAADKFLADYPRSPLAAEVHLMRGDAMSAQSASSDAGRAYLESFTLAEMVDPPLAADALFGLGRVLGELGQTRESCLTLDQVQRVYGQTPAAQKAGTLLAGMTCPQ